MNNTGIYTIESPTKKIYVGQSANLLLRTQTYAYENCKAQPKLYASLKKHGWENHKFQVIMSLKDDIGQAILNWYEQFFIDYYRSEGFELMNLKEGGAKGKHSEESKKKMSESKTGSTFSVESKKKMSDSHRLLHLGENASSVKLTNEKVLAVIAMINDGVESKIIADKFNVNRSTINRIRTGERWTHITGIKKKNSPPNKLWRSIGHPMSAKNKEIFTNWSKAFHERTSKIGKDNLVIIVQRIQSGERCEAIAKDFGVSRQLISSIKCGRNWSSLTGLQGVPSRRKLNNEMVQLIVQRVQSGEKDKIIAKEFNVCQQYISDIKRGKVYSSITGITPKQK